MASKFRYHQQEPPVCLKVPSVTVYSIVHNVVYYVEISMP